MVKLEDVVTARERIRGNVAVTPCRPSEAFTELCGAQIYFKLENLQRTGSFKERGAAQTRGREVTPRRRKSRYRVRQHEDAGLIVL